MKYNDSIFREYDIRGKYNIDYNDEFAFKLGQAIVHLCRDYSSQETINIALGKDARHSSTPLLKSLKEGVLSTGANVYELGLVTSPVTYFSGFHNKEFTGSVMITGSHNPPEYNGFKISILNKTLTSSEIQKLSSYIKDTNPSSEKGEVYEYDVISPYVKRLSEEFNFNNDISFVVDCGNGAAGSVAKKVYEACGLSPKILFEKPDGDFPNHHPDPTLEENLVDLKKEVQNSNSLFGVGYDGDADRIVIVTAKGRTVYTDELMSLYAKYVLKNHPNAQIIGDVKCSENYYKILKSWGADPIMWKTGHSLIKKKVKDLNSPFGGEFSGHIFFNDRFYGFDDALYCSLRLIEILISEEKDLESLLSYFPQTHSSPEIRIEVGEEKKHQLVELYKNEMLKRDVSINDIDGVRVNFNDGWALVRVSNTQPSVTLRFEAQSEKKLNEIMNDAAKILNLELTN